MREKLIHPSQDERTTSPIRFTARNITETNQKVSVAERVQKTTFYYATYSKAAVHQASVHFVQ